MPDSRRSFRTILHFRIRQCHNLELDKSILRKQIDARSSSDNDAHSFDRFSYHSIQISWSTFPLIGLYCLVAEFTIFTPCNLFMRGTYPSPLNGRTSHLINVHLHSGNFAKTNQTFLHQHLRHTKDYYTESIFSFPNLSILFKICILSFSDDGDVYAGDAFKPFWHVFASSARLP